jgi:hypothetical protein
MGDLLVRLLARGVAGELSGSEQRLLGFLADHADPVVQRRVFVPPFPASLRYYWPDLRALLTPWDSPKGNGAQGEGRR